MKKTIFYFLMGLLALNACTEEELPVFSGTNAIQFASATDSVKTYMFFYDDPSVESATVNFNVLTTGYTSDEDRVFKITQVFPEGVTTAEAGKHFVAFTDDMFVVKAGAVNAQVPITILRNQLEPKTAYQLTMQIETNDNFIKGDTTLLLRKLIFSPDLLKPNTWSSHATTYYLGPYSINKHAWMIEQTGQRWDDEFITKGVYGESMGTFWRDVLNQKLVKYNEEVGPLYDDDGIEIVKFP